jgi:hypothetical protein
VPEPLLRYVWNLLRLLQAKEQVVPDTDAYCIEHLSGERWIVVRIRGSEYGLRLDHADALYTALRAAHIRACDPTPLPEAEPHLLHPTRTKSRQPATPTTTPPRTIDSLL